MAMKRRHRGKDVTCVLVMGFLCWEEKVNARVESALKGLGGSLGSGFMRYLCAAVGGIAGRRTGA